MHAEVVDRATKRVSVEEPPAATALRFAYRTPAGRVITNGLINRRWLSKLVALPQRTVWSARKIPSFVQRYGIDLDEYPSQEWSSFASFFARPIPEEKRPIAPGADGLIAPADSKIRVVRIAGPAAGAAQITVKGAEYSLAALTGSHPWCERLAGGWAVIARLTVDDCHRYCHIDNGRLLGRAELPGRLDTVGPAAGPRPVLVHNHRLVSVMAGERLGRYFQIEVGALTVGRIVDPGQEHFTKGQEKGRFELGGSTIVLLFPPGAIEPAADIAEASAAGREVRVRLGEAIGRILRPGPGPAIKVIRTGARQSVAGQSGAGQVTAGQAAGQAAGQVAAGSPADHMIGAKAIRLNQMAAAGLPVPPGLVVPPPPLGSDDDTTSQDKWELSKEETQAIAAWAKPWPGETRFAVRSSGLSEDGSERSYAGRYLTVLNVERDRLPAAAAQVRASGADPSLLEYAAQAATPPTALTPTALTPAVLIQPMVEAAASGVVFTANPTGPANETVIVVGHGAGAASDEGAGPVATYWLNGQMGSAEVQPGAPTLDAQARGRLVELAGRAGAVLPSGDGLTGRRGADVEFAIDAQGRITLLQVRPVTGQATGAPCVLDNSNIVESYPGVTTPMTASFAQHVYYLVFRSLARRLSSPVQAAQRERALAAMVAWWGGRMYYQISNWYALLRLLPFEKRLIGVWQDMLGVANRQVTGPPNPLPWPKRVVVWAKSALAMARAPRDVEALHRYFQAVEAGFRRRLAVEPDRAGLGRVFRWLSDELASRWDVTLINDGYAFGFTGALTALARACGVSEPERVASELISDGRPLVSLEPLAALQQLASRAAQDPVLAERLAQLSTTESTAAWLAAPGPDAAFAAGVNAFIDRYGDRGVGELKLETATFRSDPLTLVRALLAQTGGWAQTGGRKANGWEATPDGSTVRESACPAGLASLPWAARPLAAWLAGRARRGVECRELSRLDRSRLFGMVRSLVLAAGADLVASGDLAILDDVFYLTLEEVFAPAPKGLAGLVESRRMELERVAGLPAYPRVEFAGPVIPRSPSGRRLEDFGSEGSGGAEGSGEAVGSSGGVGGGGGAARGPGRLDQRSGQGCGGGRATGRVMVVRGSVTAAQASGRILVTEVTDPGWVFTLAAAAGVVSQKGSLLSHSAIVARELGVPFVAALAGATDWLRDGDLVAVDGQSGLVRRLEKSEVRSGPRGNHERRHHR
ncbi:MAG: phosphatidylserine decarboxylase [Bifidobacteriaceae bacterium]|jgi:pyruvate,water dikinase|nr:phosphatidylserine decarboxylase [Bifidobacteriaceae bacterium]